MHEYGAFRFSMMSTTDCFNLAPVSYLCYPELQAIWVSQKTQNQESDSYRRKNI